MNKNSDIEKDVKHNGLFEALCELYGWDPKGKPEDVVESAWKAVPKYRK